MSSQEQMSLADALAALAKAEREAARLGTVAAIRSVIEAQGRVAALRAAVQNGVPTRASGRIGNR